MSGGSYALDVTVWEWRKIRLTILARDGWRCQICRAYLHPRRCGRRACPTDPEVDHIIPLGDGGRSTPDNLRACCHGCNGKRSRGLDPLAKAPDAPVYRASRQW